MNSEGFISTPVVASQAVAEDRGQMSRVIYGGCIGLIWIAFVWLNLRHLFEPFKDYGKPLAGEPYYAIRALNYLRHGYFTHWLGVCDSVIPHPEHLSFKFTEMPAFFLVNSLVFQLAGASSSSFRLVELAYALSLCVFFSLATWKLFGPKTAILSSLIFLLLPVNIFLLFISWSFLFPMMALFFYTVWMKERCRISFMLMLVSVALGCAHHVAGFFVAPAALLHALLARSAKDNKKGLAGIFSVTGAMGLLYLAQTFALRQQFETVGTKAFKESFFNIGYLHEMWVQNFRTLAINYPKLLTAVVPLLALWWLAKIIKKRREATNGDHFIVLSLIFALLFFLSFLGMVISHLHFLTLFGPFLALASARAILGLRRKFAAPAAALLLVYLAFACYKNQRWYDNIYWRSLNDQGYRLAKSLHGNTNEGDIIIGSPLFGYSETSFSPSFFFYLDRNYHGGIATLEQFLGSEKIYDPTFFLLPVNATENKNAGLLREYLLTRYPYYIEPHRKDILIFDLRAQK